MIVYIREYQKQTIRGLKNCREYVCGCDACGKELVRDRHAKQVKHHYCGRECLKRGFSQDGATGTAFAATNFERYGSYNVFASDQIKSTTKITNLNRYGVEHAPQSQIVKDKIRTTTIERYGVNSVLCLKEIHDKGITEAATPIVRAKINWSTANVKRHQTNKHNGTYLSSKMENKFHCYLVERFDEVQRAVDVNGWEIDFYIPTIDTYVQFDGVYWHGLDRSLNVILENKSPRDDVIYNTYLRDREQDLWFASNHLRLIRVTDLEFKRGKHVSFD